MIRRHGRALTRRQPGEMNSLESRYAERLETMRAAGEIDAWTFDAEKLRLAKRTWYSPDFRVVMADGEIQFHETKGFMQDDANVKLKVAAAIHPYRFFLVTWRAKQWNVVEVSV